MRTRISFTGDVTLRAGLSILDASGTPASPEIEGAEVTLIALFGGIGLASDPITIFGATVLSASAGLGDIHIVVEDGDVTLGSIVDATGSVYLTDSHGQHPQRRRCRRRLTSPAKNAAWLGADAGISSIVHAGASRPQVAALEAEAGTGGIFIVDNTGVADDRRQLHPRSASASTLGATRSSPPPAQMTVENSIIAAVERRD